MTDSDDLVRRLEYLRGFLEAQMGVGEETTVCDLTIDRISQLEREKAEEAGWAIGNRDACNAAERDAEILAEAVHLLQIYFCFDETYFDSPTITHAIQIAERRVKG